MIRRRALALIAGQIAWFSAPSIAGRGNDPVEPARHVALSLRVLQERLRACPAMQSCSSEVLHLAGLRRLLGYVVDRANHDIVLVGEIDHQGPMLHTQDLIIALRNVSLRYAARQGNNIVYAHPGCSIDPDRRTLAELQRISAEITGTMGPEVERKLDDWMRVLRLPQRVEVFGVPFDTRLSSVLVEGDAQLKKFADGSASLEVPGLESVVDMMLAIAKRDVLSGRPGRLSLSAMNRFWFHAGQNCFVEDVDVVFLASSPVRLSTEAEVVSRAGEARGKGLADPTARRFSCAFSSRWVQVAKRHPIYQEIENVFRAVAISKATRHRRAADISGLPMGHFLDGVQILETPVPRQMPGHASIKRWNHSQAVDGGHRVVALRLPSCGGVTVDVRADDRDFRQDTTGRLGRWRAAVLGARPGSQALRWPVSIGADASPARLASTCPPDEEFERRCPEEARRAS